MKRTIYRQCEVRQGPAIRLTWLPVRYATEGKVVRLRDNGNWSDGWVVSKVYPDTERIITPHPEGQIRRHRQATGDSLPRLAK